MARTLKNIAVTGDTAGDDSESTTGQAIAIIGLGIFVTIIVLGLIWLFRWMRRSSNTNN